MKKTVASVEHPTHHEPIHHEVVVPMPRKDVFCRFTEEFGLWWPREYTWSKEALVSIGLELREKGRCTERGPNGFQSDWGRVLAWRPPERLVLAWQIGPNREPQPNPAHASRVEILFCIENREQTRVVLEHRDLERHGSGSNAYRQALASEMGWPFILKRFADFVGR